MQGEHPLPAPVIAKFSKTGSTLTTGVNLLRKSTHPSYLVVD